MPFELFFCGSGSRRTGLAIVAVVAFAGCSGGAGQTISPVAAPPTGASLATGTSSLCVKTDAQSQSVALPSTGGTSGTITFQSVTSGPTGCLTVAIATGSDAAVSGEQAASRTRESSARHTDTATPTPGAVPIYSVTISGGAAIMTGYVVDTGNNVFPDGTYYATAEFSGGTLPATGLVFVAKNGVVTLQSTGQPIVISLGVTLSIDFYNKGVIPTFPEVSPTPTAPGTTPTPVVSPTIAPTNAPTATPTPVATASPTASPVPSITPSPSPAPTTLLKEGGFTPPCNENPCYYSLPTIQSELVTGDTYAGGSFNYTKVFTVNGDQYTESFSIPVASLVADESTGLGPDPAVYSDNPQASQGALSTNSDSAIFANLFFTPTPTFNDQMYIPDGCGNESCSLYFYFPGAADEDAFQTKINSYIKLLETTVPYIHNSIRRR